MINYLYNIFFYLYTLNDLTNKFNLSRKLRYDSYASENIISLFEKQVDKIESELIKQMVKTPESTRLLYWQCEFNHKYSLQEKELEKELNLNNQQPIIINLQTGVRDIKKSDNNT
ncbi:hypothetical protein [Spiroplasma endosymbiont of Polydrusus formosus]|uniref:hypothetical protein n=1 Tax=Spiroplasma endosymbiont of Polydrusus formosus TaxID=3139326 RepID=UPI0035B53D0F